MSTASFIAAIKNQAIALHAAGSCFASITIAQGIWESASGTSFVCQNTNNLFGITGSYNGQSFSYHGYKYRKYPDWPTCIQDHADFLKAVRYIPVIQAKNYREAAEALHTAGYAEDPEYSKGIIRTIEYYRLYEYDIAAGVSVGYTPEPGTIQKKKNPADAEVLYPMIDMEKAVRHILMVADDNSRGYSQTRRAEEKEDDCSTLALDGLKLAGVDIGAATYTGNAIKPLLAAGFVDVAKYIDLKTGNGLKKYDVLLRPATSARGGHMAIMVTDTDLVQAAGDADGKRGDSSGKEIYVRPYIGSFSTVPKHVLRLAQPVPVGPVGPVGQPGVFAVGEMVKIVISANTASDGSGKTVDLVYQSAKVIKVVTNVTHPYGLCYNGDGYIDAWFKAESLRK